MKKYLSLLVAFAILSLVIPVYAISTCTEDQTIFKTFSSKNSHAEKYDGTNYNNKICYQDIFGVSYSDINPHVCSTDNENAAIWLIQKTNSHVSSVEDSNYNIPVCFGDLDCHAVDTSLSEVCIPGEEIIASLSQNTNAHISEGDDPNYPIKICCKSGPVLDQNSVYWANNDINENTAINSADKNDLVRLLVVGSNLKDRSLDFKIYRREGGTLLDFLFPDSLVAEGTEVGFATWRAGNDKDDNFEDGEYYFEVSIEGDSQATRSTKDNEDQNLHYLDVSDVEDNSPPIANIAFPGNINIFFVGEQITFIQNSFDVDDHFSYEWDFGDGTILTGNSQSMINFNPTNSYITSGSKQITLTVTDDRGATDFDSITILVLISSEGGGTCGNNILESGETCEDGNTVSDDGCSSTCVDEVPGAICSNDIIEIGEGCDDGNALSGDGCSSQCLVERIIGDEDGGGCSETDDGERCIVSVINHPEDGSSHGRIVSYDATGTYAVDVAIGADSCTTTISCVSGLCPSESTGCPPCYNGVNCPVPVNGAPSAPTDADYSAINFCWVFDGGLSGNVCQFGVGGAVFDKPFSFIGRHTSSLEAII